MFACLYAGSTLVVEWKRCAGRFDVLVGRLTCWLLEDIAPAEMALSFVAVGAGGWETLLAAF